MPGLTYIFAWTCLSKGIFIETSISNPFTSKTFLEPLYKLYENHISI